MGVNLLRWCVSPRDDINFEIMYTLSYCFAIMHLLIACFRLFEPKILMRVFKRVVPDAADQMAVFDLGCIVCLLNIF